MHFDGFAGESCCCDRPESSRESHRTATGGLVSRTIIVGILSGFLAAVSGCTDNQGINAATGGLAGAAVGSQIGQGSGRTAATLAGAAIGTAVGANAPTN